MAVCPGIRPTRSYRRTLTQMGMLPMRSCFFFSVHPKTCNSILLQYWQMFHFLQSVPRPQQLCCRRLRDLRHRWQQEYSLTSASGEFAHFFSVQNLQIYLSFVQLSTPDGVVYSVDDGKTKFYDLLQLVEFYQLNAGTLPTRSVSIDQIGAKILKSLAPTSHRDLLTTKPPF